MRLVFMGTPAFALPTLNALVAAGHDVVAVYTRPPRAAGRGKRGRPSLVQGRAEALGLPVRTPTNFRQVDAREQFRAHEADAAVVAAYGLILPPAILEAPRLGCLNVHASLLPRWRGAAPIQRAILAGDQESGITIMRMEAGLDTGPTLAVRRTDIGDKDAGALGAELAALGAAAMVEVLTRLEAIDSISQPEDGVTYASKIDKAEARLDFNAGAETIARQVRAFAPAPGAWFEHDGQRVRVLAAQVVEGDGAPGEVLDDALTIACGSGAIAPTLVQRAGRGVMTPPELLRGFPIPAGSRVG